MDYPAHAPKDFISGLPEFALCGHSNAGKSSLINSLLGSAVARTSRTPGRTRGIHYFSVDQRLRLVLVPAPAAPA
jgi:GTP-binding protein